MWRSRHHLESLYLLCSVDWELAASTLRVDGERQHPFMWFIAQLQRLQVLELVSSGRVWKYDGELASAAGLPRLREVTWRNQVDGPAQVVDLLRGGSRSLRSFEFYYSECLPAGPRHPAPPELLHTLAGCVELRSLRTDLMLVTSVLDLQQHLSSLRLLHRTGDAAEPVSDLVQSVRHSGKTLSALRHLDVDVRAPAASGCGELIVALVQACPNLTSIALSLTDFHSPESYAKYIGEALGCLPLLRSVSINSCGLDVFPHLAALSHLKVVNTTVRCSRSEVDCFRKSVQELNQKYPDADIFIRLEF